MCGSAVDTSPSGTSSSNSSNSDSSSNSDVDMLVVNENLLLDEDEECVGFIDEGVHVGEGDYAPCDTFESIQQFRTRSSVPIPDNTMITVLCGGTCLTEHRLEAGYIRSVERLRECPCCEVRKTISGTSVKIYSWEDDEDSDDEDE